MNSKYSNFLTILLVIVIIAIIGIIGFLGYKYYKTYVTKNSSEEFVDTFGKDTSTSENKTKDNSNNDDITFDGVEQGGSNENTASSTGGKKKQYNGFDVAGTIEIPATGLKCPVLEQYEYSPKALETSVVVLYGAGLNQVGNTTIAGHNYRNNTFFSNNKKLKNGDKIYITDSTGKRLPYTIYDKFEAAENESDYITRDTQGAIEISLTTCTDDSKARTIILARADS